MLLFIEKVRENIGAFEQKVKQISAQLGIHPDWLMLVMFIESRLNHRAVNPLTAATGLIQFMPSTAAMYGISTAALQSMSNVQQLDYVYKYLSVYRGKMKSFVDTYLAVFFPAAMGKPDGYVIQSKNLSAEQVARVNRIYDLNQDGKITIAELKTALSKYIPTGFMEMFGVKKKQSGSGLS